MLENTSSTDNDHGDDLQDDLNASGKTNRPKRPAGIIVKTTV